MDPSLKPVLEMLKATQQKKDKKKANAEPTKRPQIIGHTQRRLMRRLSSSPKMRSGAELEEMFGAPIGNAESDSDVISVLSFVDEHHPDSALAIVPVQATTKESKPEVADGVGKNLGMLLLDVGR